MRFAITMSAIVVFALSLGSFRQHGSAHGAEGAPLQYEEFDVRFTNPLCALVSYPEETTVLSQRGERLYAKPKDAYCRRSDGPASAEQPGAPLTKLLSWISDPTTTEIFFAYFSFSNSQAADALCRAIEERGVKVTMVLDRNSDRRHADRVLACRPPQDDPALMPSLLQRGHGGSIAIAHNKIFMVNPGQARMRIAFSSANLTSGLVLHHENWNFVTLPAHTYFAQSHLCLITALRDHSSGAGVYGTFMRECRSRIEWPEETDIKAFFTPGDGPSATESLVRPIADAVTVGVAAHRFSYRPLKDALAQAASRTSTPTPTRAPTTVKMVFDDDVHWVTRGVRGLHNSLLEAQTIQDIVSSGALVKFMETNHQHQLLHHN